MKDKSSSGSLAGSSGGSGAACVSSGGAGPSNKSLGNTDIAGSSGLSSTGCGKIGVDKAHCLPVIRALVAFMLHVDITCNVDLFLISCKVSFTSVATTIRKVELMGNSN